jgi:hypothetical protein
MLFGLGACGESTSGTITPAILTALCGEIVVSGTPSRTSAPDAALQSANCFAQSFQSCRATSLTIRDTTNNLTRQFSILPDNAGCTLREALQTDPNSPPAVGDCKGVQVDNRILLIQSCSDFGDFTLTL